MVCNCFQVEFDKVVCNRFQVEFVNGFPQTSLISDTIIMYGNHGRRL